MLFAKPFVALVTLPIKGSFSISCTQRFKAERAGRQKKLQDLEQVTNKGSNDHYASHLQFAIPIDFCSDVCCYVKFGKRFSNLHCLLNFGASVVLWGGLRADSALRPAVGNLVTSLPFFYAKANGKYSQGKSLFRN